MTAAVVWHDLECGGYAEDVDWGQRAVKLLMAAPRLPAAGPGTG